MDDQKSGTSRRDFLKAGSIVGAGLATSVLGVKAVAAAAVPAKWDEEYDVVVIGSGFAGLAAAYTAKKAGASVVVLEKMRTLGGNSIINGGVVAAAGSPEQEKMGVKDSPELLFQDMLKAGKNLNHKDLAMIVAKQSWPMVKYTMDEWGVEYSFVAHLGGHSVPRSYNTANGSGSGIVSKQIEACKKIGIPLKTRTYVDKIVMDEDKRVCGVKVLDGYRFGREGSGKTKAIRAKKGVVLASGGFGNDPVFRAVQDPTLGPDVKSTNQPGATSEVLRQALGVGCTPVQISWIQIGPWTSPDEKGMGLSYSFSAVAAANGGMWISPKTGKRFVNELADRKIRADAILATGNICLSMAQESVAKQFKALNDSRTQAALKAGTMKKFDSYEAIAAEYKINLAGFQEQIARYNELVKAGVDEDFGRPMKKGVYFNEPPYYVARLWPKVHHTMGGVQINQKAEAIGLDGKPIKGLYAAGEVTGGVHGAVRLGSVAVIDCLVFGRIAGQSASA